MQNRSEILEQQETEDGLSPWPRKARHTVHDSLPRTYAIMNQQAALSLVADSAVAGGRGSATRWKSSREFQDGLWTKWPAETDWPGRLDVYEAAAYCRVSPDLIRDALTLGRDGKARLPHNKLGNIYRIRKSDLDVYGQVLGR
jgi:hypothetical protein